MDIDLYYQAGKYFRVSLKKCLALEKISPDKLQVQMVYLKGLLEEAARFETNIVRRIYSLLASLATAGDQELLIFINKQIRHFDTD